MLSDVHDRGQYILGGHSTLCANCPGAGPASCLGGDGGRGCCLFVALATA